MASSFWMRILPKLVQDGYARTTSQALLPAKNVSKSRLATTAILPLLPSLTMTISMNSCAVTQNIVTNIHICPYMCSVSRSHDLVVE